MRSLERVSRAIRLGIQPSNFFALQQLLILLLCDDLRPLLRQRPRLLVKALGQHRQLNWTANQRIKGLVRHFQIFRDSPLVKHVRTIEKKGLILYESLGQKTLLVQSRYSTDYLDCDQEGELEIRWIANNRIVWVMAFFLDRDPVTGSNEIHLTRNQGTNDTLKILRDVRKEIENLDFFRVAFSALVGVAKACKATKINVVNPAFQCTLGNLNTAQLANSQFGTRQYQEVFITALQLEDKPTEAFSQLSIQLPLAWTKKETSPKKWRGRYLRSRKLLSHIEDSSKLACGGG
jgi:uncharacterized protein VirK/YbjX